jgi:hypothetical protein
MITVSMHSNEPWCTKTAVAEPMPSAWRGRDTETEELFAQCQTGRSLPHVWQVEEYRAFSLHLMQ